eukprot:16439683-Heterocapsa_arctica.AAC.1
MERTAQEKGFAPVTSDDIGQSKFLYNLLVTLCHGRALAIVRMVRRADGCGAWRRLVMEYEPESAGRYCAMLSGILVPAWS